MSYFGTKLTLLMEKRDLNAAELSRLSGVDDSKISRYRSGEQVWVNLDHLEKLARTLSDNPRERAELIEAHLRDECRGPGAELIHIMIGDGIEMKDTPAEYRAHPLPAYLEEAIAVIRQNLIHDKNVRELIEGLANLLRSGDARTQEELRAGGQETSPAPAKAVKGKKGAGKVTYSASERKKTMPAVHQQGPQKN